MDQDLEYKLFAKRLAWTNGYFSFLEVPIQSPPPPGDFIGKRYDVTDIDVLSYRVDFDGRVRLAFFDCKTTKDKAPDRVFWVNGLSNYLEASSAYLIKKKIPDHARWLAERLGISVLSEQDISNMDDMLGLKHLRSLYFAKEGYEALSKALYSSPRGSDYFKISKFLNYTVWELAPGVRANSLLELFKSHNMNKKFRPEDSLHSVLILRGALQLGLTVAMLTEGIQACYNNESLKIKLREQIWGGAQHLADRLEIIKGLVDKEDSLDIDPATLLDTDGFSILAELSARFIMRRYLINDALRLLDLSAYYTAMNQRMPHLTAIRNPLAYKMARDIIFFFATANGLNLGFIDLIPLLVDKAFESDESRESTQTEQSIADDSKEEVTHQGSE